VDLASLTGSPNPLAAYYRRFAVADRLLLTGHSHQAWPDAGFEAQADAWLDAAELVDEKWERAFARADQVREGFVRLLGDAGDGIALAPNTHELVVRLLSALPLRARPRLVTTDGEFHTIRRQLDRLAEEGIEVVRVPEAPLDTVGERVAAAVDDRTAAALVSLVFFDSGRIARGLDRVAASCRRHGAALLVDAYHALNVVPVSLAELDLLDAFVVGGGYKYCQLGEGNCFLRLPPGSRLRPVITGWFSEFTALTDREHPERVAYGEGGDRFAGATYDPASHYRGAAVFRFFREQGLTAELLRRVSQQQIGVLTAGFDALDLDPAVIRRDRPVPLEEIGGFLALHAPAATVLARRLFARGLRCDARGEVLRLGPAPYLSELQLREAIRILGEVARDSGRSPDLSP
jgi:selenocysteine lyase/cysteine desulfurase